MLSPGIEKCINAYPLSEWKKLAAALTSGSITQSKLRRLNRAVFATAFQLNLDGQGRIAAVEVMILNRAIKNLIREGKTHQIDSVIQTGKASGMQTMESHINHLVQTGRLSQKDADLFGQETV